MFKMKFKSHNLVTHLQSCPSRLPACIALGSNGQEMSRVTYAELDKKARAMAAYLQTETQIGDRVLLAYPAGIDFVVAFLGCLYAGVIAVPFHCEEGSDGRVSFQSLHAIALDANIAGIVTLENYCDDILRTATTLFSTRNCFLLNTASLDVGLADKFRTPALDEQTIAYLHYTTGSAETLKAVVVRHTNLTHALKYTAKVWSYTKKSVTLTWLPLTTLPGLLFGVLVPLYSSATTLLLSPEVVRRSPLTWLQAITRYRVTHSGALNSGYDLCVREIDPVDCAGLNLRSWKVAFNGGEQVMYDTLAGFTKKFSQYGFRFHLFNSLYMVSEAVGIVSVGDVGKAPTAFLLDVNRLRDNEVVIAQKDAPHRKFVGNGQMLQGLEAVVVDTDKWVPLTEGKVGEIWLTGESIVTEYWHEMNDDHSVFDASLPGIQEKFFRTGDLGFIKNGEICFTGRQDEVVFSGSKRYNPVDLETTAMTALRSFPAGYLGAVFSINLDFQNVVVYVHEVKEGVTSAILDEMVRHVHRAFVSRYGIKPHAVLLVKEHSLPKAANGKLQRRLCQKEYLAGRLAVVNADTAHSVNTRLTTPVEALSPEPVIVSQPVAAVYAHDPKDIAVIGMSGLFPGADNLDAFWDNLVRGVDAITEVPAARWHWRDYYDDAEREPYKADIKWGGFLADIAAFDAGFFSISPHEAELTDPQQRLFLQTVYRAIEDAGYTTTAFSERSVGVFVGASHQDYAELLQGIEDAHTTNGLSRNMIANRISCLFKLKGPSQVIDTAGSSSLTALHQALQALKSGDCEVAVVGGVNGILTPTQQLSLSKAGLLSEEGKCKAFDKNANGYVRGEGVAALILKPLHQAEADGDAIYGIIKSTAVNHGAHARSLATPCQQAQAEVVIKACERANISPDTLSYIETNAAGHLLDDAIEVNGLKRAFDHYAETRSVRHYCGLGSVKTNIGHLESAAGMASILKILLAMRHRQLPGSLHFTELNPQIELMDSPFYIVDELQPWERFVGPDGAEVPRRAGVSAFGVGGTNAHVILEEYMGAEESIADTFSQPYLITLSAKTDEALQQRITDLLVWIEQQTVMPALAALSYTLNQGRHHFDKRCAMVVESIPELRETLRILSQHGEPDNAIINQEKIDKKKYRPIFQALFKQLMNDLANDKVLCLPEYRNNLLALGNFYTEGYDLEWSRLHRGEKQRLSLPAYPFTKEHYWVPNPAVILEFNAPLQGGVSSG